MAAASGDILAGDKLKTALESDDTYVHESLEDSLSLFLSMQTQWRTGMSGATGLDYNALPITARLIGVKLTKEVFAHISIMERRALTIMSQSNKKA